jgi:glyoxylase-like metal-dependent hydrolase (beta-lactamase superfamily II)
MTPIELGEVTISRVVEVDRSSLPTTAMLPDSTADAIVRHHHWLKPHFWDDRIGDLGARIQSYLVRTPEHTILVDTCFGNDKERPGFPAGHRRQGRYLEDLRAAGAAPEDIDLVVCTHLHIDHVGWNTQRVDGRWVPTFPKATYVFVGEEWEFWKRENQRGAEPYGCVADSVVPIVDAGRARIVDSDDTLGTYLHFEASRGHTPGHTCLRLRTSGGEAIFSGDIMHRTVQVAEPGWSSIFCYDGEQATRTRQEFVERHADSGVLVLAAHFPVPGYIVREGGGHRFQPAQRGQPDGTSVRP